MDCDSLVLSIKTDDLIKDLIKLQEKICLILMKLLVIILYIVIKIWIYLVNSKLRFLIQNT